MPAQCAYSASKFGLVGLAQSAAKELGRHRIRVNTLNQYGVNTPMGLEDSRGMDIIAGDPFYGPHFVSMMPDIPVAEVDDISDSVLFLCSERARVITGATFQADMGWTKV
jgi:NAD(P)-dependent dehydrogenase (short-subunit alcohol dehydrogenase family)